MFAMAITHATTRRLLSILELRQKPTTRACVTILIPLNLQLDWFSSELHGWRFRLECMEQDANTDQASKLWTIGKQRRQRAASVPHASQKKFAKASSTVVLS